MLTFIKTNYQTGDAIEVTCSEGTVTGTIEYVTSKYIVLRQSNGQLCGIAANDVRSFRANCPVPMVPAHGEASVVKAPAYDPEDLNLGTNSNADDAPNEEQPQTLRDVIGNEETADHLTGAAPVAEPKVIGHIDLASVDPKYGRRSYFRSDETQNNNDEGSNNYASQYQRNGFQRQPYVGARGRITYYNSLKRFGFIHDYNSDSDLYFYIQQIVDNELYDHLHKGTKVVYNIGHNNQGAIAMNIHLPHTVNDLYTMAEDSFDDHHYYAAKGMLEHILEVDPDNADAKQLLSDVETALPTVENEYQRGELQPYNPCLLYAQAKRAYLAKDYDEAERAYKEALEANEKPESCVKDLLTLYVSLYKQTDDNDEKVMLRQKASDFFEAHKQLLSDNLTTKQFLALNYYLPIQDYNKFLATVDDLLTDPQVSHMLSRRVFYLWQKGIALNKMGRTEEALAICDEGLKLSPYNRQLANLRELILHPELLQQHTDEAPANNNSNEPTEVASIAETAEAVAEDVVNNNDNKAEAENADKDNDSPISTQAEPWWK